MPRRRCFDIASLQISDASLFSFAAVDALFR